MSESRCTIEEPHCESCGSTDHEDVRGGDSYTTCCNELVAVAGSVAYAWSRGHPAATTTDRSRHRRADQG